MELLTGRKMTMGEVLERLADDRIVEAERVLSSALKRQVWVAEWHLPGCLSESRSICLTKGDAIASALSFAEDGEKGPPRGMRAALERDGQFTGRSQMYGTVVTTVRQHTLAEIL